MHPHDGRVVSNFVIQALNNEPITVYGDGSQSRSFCYVSDMIDAFIKTMETDDGFTGPVNLGNPVEFSIRQLAEKAIAMTDSESTLEYCPLPADDPRQRCPDISLAQEKLGWQPTVNLDQGLEETIAWFRKSR